MKYLFRVRDNHLTFLLRKHWVNSADGSTKNIYWFSTGICYRCLAGWAIFRCSQIVWMFLKNLTVIVGLVFGWISDFTRYRQPVFIHFIFCSFIFLVVKINKHFPLFRRSWTYMAVRNLWFSSSTPSSPPNYIVWVCWPNTRIPSLSSYHPSSHQVTSYRQVM